MGGVKGKVLNDVLNEIERIDAKWKDQSHLPASERLAILTEEVGEVARATLESKGLRDELVQVAAVALKWIDDIDKPRRIVAGMRFDMPSLPSFPMRKDGAMAFVQDRMAESGEEPARGELRTEAGIVHTLNGIPISPPIKLSDAVTTIRKDNDQ